MKWRPLSRRGFLASAGTILPLPFLESLVPKAVRAQAATPIQRAVFVFSPNGFIRPLVFPDTPGANYTMPTNLASLQPYRAKVSLPMHVDNSCGHFPGDHANGTGCFLVNQRPASDSAPAQPLTASFDWQLATSMSGGSKKVMQLGWGADTGDGGAGDFGVSMKYINSVSWSSPTQQEIALGNGSGGANVLDQFNAFFANPTAPKATTADQVKRALYGKSVLDFNLAEVNSLSKKLGSADQKKLSQYMAGVSDLEAALSGSGGGMVNAGAGCKTPTAPVRVSGTNYYGAWQKAGYGMAAMALECDMARVVTYMLGPGFSNQSYGFLGISGAEYSADTEHHILSHHGTDQTMINKLSTIDKFTFDQFAGFVGLMDSIDDGGGKTLLDNSVAYISSDVADGDHDHTNYPVVMAGSCAGKLKTGQYWDLTGKLQADIFSTIYSAFGINKKHADSTGPIAALLV